MPLSHCRGSWSFNSHSLEVRPLCLGVIVFPGLWLQSVFFFLLSTLQSQYIVSMLGSTDWQCDGATGWMLLSG